MRKFVFLNKISIFKIEIEAMKVIPYKFLLINIYITYTKGQTFPFHLAFPNIEINRQDVLHPD